MLRHLLTPNFCSRHLLTPNIYLRHTILFKTTQKQNRLTKKNVISLGRTITDNINQLITVTKHNILSFLIKMCINLVIQNLIGLRFPTQIIFCSIFGDTEENFGDTQMCRDTQFEKHWSTP